MPKAWRVVFLALASVRAIYRQEHGVAEIVVPYYQVQFRCLAPKEWWRASDMKTGTVGDQQKNTMVTEGGLAGSVGVC